MSLTPSAVERGWVGCGRDATACSDRNRDWASLRRGAGALGHARRDTAWFCACAAVVLMLLTALPGCAMHEVLRTEPGLDVSFIRPGLARGDVEAVLGLPRSEWTAGTGVRYAVYRYYAGKDASAEGVLFVGFFDVVSLGLFEVFWALSPNLRDLSEDGRKHAFLAVSYDREDRVIGVFTNISEFASLPVDGEAPARVQGQPQGGARNAAAGRVEPVDAKGYRREKRI